MGVSSVGALPGICVECLGRKKVVKTFRSLTAARKYIQILRSAGLRWRLTLAKT